MVRQQVTQPTTCGVSLEAGGSARQGRLQCSCKGLSVVALLQAHCMASRAAHLQEHHLLQHLLL